MSKSIFIIAAIALFASAAYLMVDSSSSSLSQSRMDQDFISQWNSFKTSYAKEYKSVDIEVYRMNIFRENLIKVRNHKDTSYTVGINEFSDLTSDEFASMYFGFRAPKNRTYAESRVMVQNLTASNINWTALGDVQPVQNQGQCGSCWAFSAISAIESAYAVYKNVQVKLSEEQLVQCSSKYGNAACQGGLMDSAFDYAEDHGLCTEQDYPYTSKYGLVGVCKVKKAKKCTTYKVANYTDVPEGNCTSLYNALTLQPVAVAVDASNWQSYKGGVFPSASCNATLNHGVSLTGFVATGNTPYWVVKNSWGPKWGNDGYINLANGNTCGICDAASYPSVV